MFTAGKITAGKKFAILAFAAVLAGCAGSSASSDTATRYQSTPASSSATSAAEADPLAEDLAAIREATERFRDVNVALAEGYMPDPTNMCVSAKMVGAPAELGAMGVHYFRPDLLGITATRPRVVGNDGTLDWLTPEILVYEPQADGAMELVAVEYLVFEKGWQAAGNTELPSFHGTPFFRMEDDPATPMDEAHMFEPHYELHVWIYRENPNGMFREFNPAVTCEHHTAQASPMGK